MDPGLQCTGYGVVDVNGRACSLIEGGVIRTDASAPLELRLHSLYEGLFEVMRELQPEMAAVEKLYTQYNHPQTAVLMGHARGVIYLAAAQNTIPVCEYEASRIKKAITGSGRASKEQVGRMVCELLSLEKPPQPVDITDALALAICQGRPMGGGERTLHPDILRAMRKPGRHK